MTNRWTNLILLLLPLLVSCEDDPTRPDIEIQGRFSLGFEVSALEPCNLEQSWWVTNPSVLVDQYDAIADHPYKEVFISVVGVRSKLGNYGHFGHYDREFKITEIREIREIVDGDCP